MGRIMFSKRLDNIEPSAVRVILRVIGKSNIISFAGGLPDSALFPAEEVKKACEKVLEESAYRALQYSVTEGVEELREELYRFMVRRGVLPGHPRDDEEILVTSGSQEALFLITHVLIDPGDIVVTERPTYLAMLQILYDHYAEIVDIDLDPDGLDTYKLEEVVRSLQRENKKPKFVYVVPTCQNPTGITMSMDRRKHLLEIAETYDILILEDDPYSYYLYEPIDVKPLKYLDSSGKVLYVSTFSKILAPGLRIGWVVGPREIIQEVAKAKQVLNLQSPTFTQFVVTNLLREQVVDRRLPLLAEHYRKKRDAMLNALETYVGDLADWVNPVGGMFVWVKLRRNIDTMNMLQLAVEKYGVAYVPGAPFYPSRPEVNTMRLNFTYPSVDMIEIGIRKLAELIRELST